MTRSEARESLARAHVPAGEDFHRLRSGQVESLLAEAKRLKYRTPRNANGSRARMFCQYLQRVANRKEA